MIVTDSYYTLDRNRFVETGSLHLFHVDITAKFIDDVTQHSNSQAVVIDLNGLLWKQLDLQLGYILHR